MLAASYYFYAYWNVRFVFLLMASTLFNQLLGVAIHRNRNETQRRLLLGVAVVGNLGILGYFKYYDFFISSFQNMLDGVGIEISPSIISITLPVGISFFTFQALSYVIDIYRRQLEPTSLIDFAVYESFFPHLVAGPIVRAAEFLPQLKERHDPRRIDASKAFFLIFLGLFKKVVLANFLATEIVDRVFAQPGTPLLARVARRDLRLRGPDLLRLQRLHRHGDRARAAARLPVPAELRRALHGGDRSRTSGAAGT